MKLTESQQSALNGNVTHGDALLKKAVKDSEKSRGDISCTRISQAWKKCFIISGDTVSMAHRLSHRPAVGPSRRPQTMCSEEYLAAKATTHDAT